MIETQPVASQHAGEPLYHVAGILVHAAHGRADSVARRIAGMPGALVHAQAGGKIAATLESDQSRAVADALNTIQAMSGVVSAVLVSEHSEPLTTIDEEIGT
jgi:nitrate reductase NapAB chaperone NapD